MVSKNCYKLTYYNFKKNFTYFVVVALVIALCISCDAVTNPNDNFKHSDLVGTWTGGGHSFTINSSGYVNFAYGSSTYNGDILGYIGMEEESSAIDAFVYDSGYSDSDSHTNGSIRKLARFYFSNPSSCYVIIEVQKYSGVYPNGSWQTEITHQLGTFAK